MHYVTGCTCSETPSLPPTICFSTAIFPVSSLSLYRIFKNYIPQCAFMNENFMSLLGEKMPCFRF
uniref:Uncharacterized protein n=1 Tax=Anguilla anguilla TaxID=7936 RepID=A0A0E9SY40_ANGAN